LVGAALLVAAASAAVAVPAHGETTGASRTTLAGPMSQGTPGYCKTKKGVTVVVDFNELGGGIVVRCAPGPVGSGYTGLDALQDAGFTPEGTKRWGLQFVCRIAGKPAPDQKLPIKGDPNYREACVDTPPAEAFWSYWYAPNGGTWTLSAEGPVNRDAIPGGFEGWSFSLNHSQQTAPPPGVAPKRPHEPPPTTPPPTTPHSSPPHTSPHSTPPTHGGGSGSTGRPPTSPPSTRQATTAAGPTSTATPGSRRHRDGAGARSPGPPSTTSSAVAPAPTDNPVAVGHNAAGEKVSGQLPSGSTRSTGSPAAAVAGVLVLAVLAAGGYVAWRRRARSE
jgi:hypothetical protein